MQTSTAYKKTHLTSKTDITSKVWKFFFQTSGPKKQAGVAILISNKIDLKLKSIKRDKEGHFTLVTGKIHQE